MDVRNELIGSGIMSCLDSFKVSVQFLNVSVFLRINRINRILQYLDWGFFNVG